MDVCCPTRLAAGVFAFELDAWEDFWAKSEENNKQEMEVDLQEKDLGGGRQTVVLEVEDAGGE